MVLGDETIEVLDAETLELDKVTEIPEEELECNIATNSVTKFEEEFEKENVFGYPQIATESEFEEPIKYGSTYPNTLCFLALETSTIKYLNFGTNISFIPPVLYYSINNTNCDIPWNADTTSGESDIINLSVNDKIYVRGYHENSWGDRIGLGLDSSSYTQFVMTGKIEASGNITGLIDDGACTLTNLNSYGYCFYKLFENCTVLTKPPEFPATTLGPSCYEYTFNNCTSLIEAPRLPATTLTSECYLQMFSNCSSLTTIPEFSPTILSGLSCYRMFQNCTALTSFPSLEGITTVAGSSCLEMFKGCSNLKTATVPSATTLMSNCYNGMYRDCVNILEAPNFPSSLILAYSCFIDMYNGCTNLRKIPNFPYTQLENDCYTRMFYNCSALKINNASLTSNDIIWEIPGGAILPSGDFDNDMFVGTSGTFTSTPTIGVSYYIQGVEVLLDNNTLNLVVSGNTGTLTATIIPTTEDQTVTWSTSNSSVATVNNGIVSPLGVGTITIYATSVANPLYHAECTVVVTLSPLPIPTPAPSPGGGGSGGGGSYSDDLYSKLIKLTFDDAKANSWYKDVKGNWYYMDSDRNATRGWHFDMLDKQWYYLDPNTCIMVKGYITIDDKTYYFNENLDNGNWYKDEKTLTWHCYGRNEKSLGALIPIE